MPSFMLPVLNFVVEVVGGGLTLVFVAIALILSLYALQEIAEDSLVFFRKISRLVGVVVAVFGLFLPFRGISYIPMFLSFWWTSILFEAVPQFSVIQLAVNAVLSICFWARYSPEDEYGFFTRIGDWSLFLVLPIGFSLALLSRKSDVFGGRGRGLANLAIPLSQWFKALYNLATKIV